MTEQTIVLNILADSLSLPADKLDESDELMGAIPEFDSMSVVNILTMLEDHYGFVIDDDEIDSEIFSTVASLIEFVKKKNNS